MAAAKRGTPASPGKQASDPSFLLAGPLDQELGRDLNRVAPYSPFRMILESTLDGRPREGRPLFSSEHERDLPCQPGDGTVVHVKNPAMTRQLSPAARRLSASACWWWSLSSGLRALSLAATEALYPTRGRASRQRTSCRSAGSPACPRPASWPHREGRDRRRRRGF